jgi:hypothetical protein
MKWEELRKHCRSAATQWGMEIVDKAIVELMSCGEIREIPHKEQIERELRPKVGVPGRRFELRENALMGNLIPDKGAPANLEHTKYKLDAVTRCTVKMSLPPTMCAPLSGINNKNTKYIIIKDQRAQGRSRSASKWPIITANSRQAKLWSGVDHLVCNWR